MSPRSPIERSIDATARCVVCGSVGVGTCGCWVKCACGRMKRDNEEGCPHMRGPPQKIVHRGKLIRSDGAVVALCTFVVGSKRVVDLRRATWTNRDEAVTCPRCEKAMTPRPSGVPKDR